MLRELEVSAAPSSEADASLQVLVFGLGYVGLTAAGCLAAGITHLIGESPGPDYDLSSLRKLIAWRDSRMGSSS